MRIKQIIKGAALTMLGIVSIFIDNDATAAILIIPLGLYVIFTEENLEAQ